MTTATTKAPKQTKARKPKPAPAKATEDTPVQKSGLVGNGEYRCEIPHERIHISPTNPRKHFDAGSLKTLCESIKVYGLLQPIIVTPVKNLDGAHFEIIAGERRYRASIMAGVEAIPCIVRPQQNRDQIPELQLIENIERKDLNPIEVAQSYADLTKPGGLSQKDLAKRLKVSPSAISNQIRLLNLPEPWRSRLISQEMPATHARYLLPWSHRPELLKEIEERVIDEYGSGKFPSPEALTVRDLEGAISDAARQASRTMETPTRAFDATPAELEALDIQEVQGEERAFNVNLYDELQAAAKKEQKKQSGAGKPKTKADPKEALEDRKEAIENQLRDYLWGVLEGDVIAALEHCEEPELLRLLVVLCMNGWASQIDFPQCDQAIVTAGGRLTSFSYASAWGNSTQSATDYLDSLSSVPGENHVILLRELLKRSIESNSAGFDHADRHYLKKIHSLLTPGLAVTWKITREYLEIYEKDELIELAIKEFEFNGSLTLLEDQDCESLIEFMLSHFSDAKCPKSLLKLLES